MAAITSVTAQNAEKFFGAKHESAESVRAQVEAIIGATDIAAIKIGMLPTSEIVSEVARLIRNHGLPAPVVDPAMRSTSGGKLMEDEALQVFVTELLPLARVVTPNIPEAEKLTGLSIRDEDGMQRAAARIRELGARAVLVKGGHLTQEAGGRRQASGRNKCEAVDLLDEEGQVSLFRSEWIETENVRGTGCILSSAIAASQAKGLSLEDAVAASKAFVADRMRSSNWRLTTDD